DKNLGVAKATEAAKIINGYLAIPRFDRDKGETGTDFNDLHALHGSRAVHDALDAALDAGTLKGEEASIYDEALPKEPPGFFYPVGETTSEPALPTFQFFDAFVESYKPPEYLLDHVFVSGSLYTITAATGTGKTAF